MITNRFATTHYGRLINQNSTSNLFLFNQTNNQVTTNADYLANQDIYKQQASHRMGKEIFNIVRNEEGTVTDMVAVTDGSRRFNWGLLALPLVPNHNTTDNVGYDIDYLASEYVNYQNQIKRLYSEEEQAEQLQKLDQLMSKQVEKYAEKFAEITGDFFNQNGVVVQAEDIKSSLIDHFHQRTEQYQHFYQQNQDYAHLKGTEDEWLLDDTIYMGDYLRYAFTQEHSEMSVSSEHGYHIEELVAVGTIASETWQMAYQSRHLGSYKNKSEEELGVSLGLMAMKYELISDNYQLSDPFKAKLDQAFKTYLQVENEKACDYVTQQQKDPYVRNKQAYKMDWNEQLVYDIIERMVSSLQTHDVQQAIEKDILIITEMYKDNRNQHLNVSRYNNHNHLSTINNYVQDWNRFIKATIPDDQVNDYLLDVDLVKLDLKV
ncbi:hypothetical protein [Amphibacillus cookii]|uniref:hypothetical protein n=1 Tax=Amphibacillus cookii TaxID=767787 RepID=UPI0019574304|nr:hypothetical protein [Amphibacillus cookii]MBM7542170.1 hypothetical protein [Amphibacillus cookii]